MKDLGKRMKHNYEGAFQTYLPFRMPVIIRIDGKAFHSYTKNLDLDKPFSNFFWELIHETGLYVAENISGVQCVYSQSDEISILVHTYKKLDTNPYAGNEIQKLVSHSASLATAYFNNRILAVDKKLAIFDSRVFVLPEAEVNNYFIWRQKDCIRNSISSLGQYYFSHKELQKKNSITVIQMLKAKGVFLDSIEKKFMYGKFSTLNNNNYGYYAPDFIENPKIIENLLKQEEF